MFRHEYTVSNILERLTDIDQLTDGSIIEIVLSGKVLHSFYLITYSTALSPLLFAIVVNVVTESVRSGSMSEMLYADNLVLTSETMEGLREKFWKWKEAYESKGLKVEDKSVSEWCRR